MNASERDLRRRMCQSQRVRMVEEFADILQQAASSCESSLGAAPQDLDRKEEQAKHAVEARKLQAKMRTESRLLGPVGLGGHSHGKRYIYIYMILIHVS